MNIRNFPLVLISGCLAVFVYSIAVILGGMQYPGYSHVSNTVSELTASLSPTRNLLSPLFLLYNLALLIFGIGVRKLSWNMVSKLGSVLVIMVALLGITMNWFPQDSMGTPMTERGQVHIVLAGMMALGTLGLSACFGVGLKKSKPMLSGFSLLTTAVLLFSGPVAGLAVASGYPWGGLAERIPIGTFLLWIMVMSCSLFRKLR